jgi:Flp pilus assembly protein TadG
VEVALILPLVLLVTFGVMEFGYFYFLQHNFMAAAQSGVRTWVRAGTAAQSDVDAAVAVVLSPLGVPNTKYTTTYTVNGAEAPVNTAVKGDIIAIDLEADWGGASGVGLRPMGVLDASKKVHAVAIMQKE